MSLSGDIALQYIRTKFRILSAISKRKAAAAVFKLFTTTQKRVKKPLTPFFLQAEGLTTVFEGHTIKGFRWNTGGHSKLLILHGHESTIINFEGFVQGLIDKGYEVMGFDAPAHGYSEGTTINALIYQKFVQHIAGHFGPVTNFIAHSLGGLALCLFLENKPSSESWKAALIAPAVETTTAIDHYFAKLILPANLRPVFDNYISRITGRPPEWFSIRRAAAHIKCRVLFLQDKEDYMTPYCDMEPILQAAYPNFRFVISEGLGHRRIYRDEGSVKTVTDFF